MYRKSIIINNRMYEINQSADWLGQEDRLSDFEYDTLKFIRDWLSGQNIFNTNTSGSTGHPKTITIHRSQMEASAKRTVAFFGLAKHHKALVCIPTAFIGGKMMLVRALEANMSIIATEPSALAIKQIEDTQNGFIALVPLQLQAILNDHIATARLSQCRAAIIGGGSIAEKDIGKLQTIPCPVYNTFGMTETISHIALRKMNGNNANQYFQTLPQVGIERDEDDCLIISAKDITGVDQLRTNDRVLIHNPNSFTWLGRKDNVINTGGIKIQIELLEQKIAELFTLWKFSCHFFIDSVADEKLGEKIILVVQGPPLPDLPGKLKKNMSKYECPKAIYYTDTFAKTPTGKILRKESLKRALKTA